MLGVLIEESVLGKSLRNATWGTGDGQEFLEEISDGGAPREIPDRDRRLTPWLHAGAAQRSWSIRMTRLFGIFHPSCAVSKTTVFGPVWFSAGIRPQSA